MEHRGIKMIYIYFKNKMKLGMTRKYKYIGISLSDSPHKSQLEENPFLCIYSQVLYKR